MLWSLSSTFPEGGVDVCACAAAEIIAVVVSAQSSLAEHAGKGGPTTTAKIK